MTDESTPNPPDAPKTDEARRRQAIALGATVAAIAVGALVVTMVMGGDVPDALPYVLGAPIGLLVARWLQGRGPKDMPAGMVVDGFSIEVGEIAPDAAFRAVKVSSPSGSTAAFVAGEVKPAMKTGSPGTWNGDAIQTDRGVGAKVLRVRRAGGGTVMEVRRVEGDSFAAEVGGATIAFAQPKGGDRRTSIEQAVAGAAAAELPDNLATLAVAYVASGQSRWLP